MKKAIYLLIAIIAATLIYCRIFYPDGAQCIITPINIVTVPVSDLDKLAKCKIDQINLVGNDLYFTIKDTSGDSRRCYLDYDGFTQKAAFDLLTTKSKKLNAQQVAEPDRKHVAQEGK